jgi:hypothetical protein
VDWLEEHRLLGKCYDFESAYKQCAVCPCDASVASFAFARRGYPVRPVFFRAHALPFGATASALHFNRAAAGLRACFVRLLGVGVENYFDGQPYQYSTSTGFLTETRAVPLGGASASVTSFVGDEAGHVTLNVTRFLGHLITRETV